VLEAILEGVGRALAGPGPLIIVAGTLYGMLVGVLPGISGAVGIVLLVPVTFAWPLDHALLLFAAAWGGSSYGGAITAILIKIPGESTNAMTTLDGYPMATQGRASEALGASALATALGATFGIVVLVAMIPVLRSIVLLFGPAEFFALALLGISVIALVSSESLVKGLFSGALGLLVGLHGYNPITGVSRFDFGTIYLLDGIPLFPVFIGMFAMAQAIELAVHHQTVVAGESLAVSSVSVAGLFRGMRAVFEHFWLFLRCSIIGTIVGAIPGPGGAVATFLAYGHAKASAKDSSRFGRGDIRGVIAPEAANDAKDGGSLMPTIAFGVPGTVASGVMLLALEVHGVRTGPELLGPNLALVFVLLTSLFASNWLTSLFGVATARWLARLTTIPTSFIAAVVIVTSVIGALATRGLFEDVLVMLLFGAIGYLFILRSVPVVPMVIALLLVTILETSLNQVLQIGAGSPHLLWTRPIALGLLVLVGLTIFSPLIRRAIRLVRS
jgi:putative tricarboxylic transport membrane protein